MIVSAPVDEDHFSSDDADDADSAEDHRPVHEGEHEIGPKTEEEIQSRIDMLLSGDRVEEFLVELERRMIAGYTYRARRTWAKVEYSVGETTVDQIEALLRHGHRLENLNFVALGLAFFSAYFVVERWGGK